MPTTPETTVTDPPAPPEAPPPTVTWRSLLPEAVTLVFCVVLFTQTLGLRGTSQGPGPAMYPRILIALLALTMLVRLVGQVRALRSGVAVGADSAAETEVATIPLALVGQVVALAIGFVVGTIYLGWLLATFLFVPVFCWAVGKRNLLLTVPFGGVLALGSAYIFVRFVYIALPTGVGVFDDLTVELFIALGIY